MKIVACDKCELIYTRGKWTKFYLADVGESELNDFFSQEILQIWDFFYKPTEISLMNMRVTLDEITFTPHIFGLITISASPDVFVPLIQISEDLEINLEWGECIECRTRLSGSYSSKIQVRTERSVEQSALEEWALEIEHMSSDYLTSDRKNPLFKIIYLKNGFDVLFRTKAPANTVGRIFARKNGGMVSVTTEFAGFDKSKWKEYPRKPVVLISLPPFEIGELVEYNKKIVQIHSFRDQRVEYWDFEKKEWLRIPIKQFMDAKPQKIDYIELELQVVAFEHDGTAQLMSTDNFEIFYVLSSDIGSIKEGDQIQGFLYEEALYVKQEKNKE